MLMAEEDFRKLFPSQSGFGTVLIEATPEDEAEVRKELLSNLGDYSVTVDRTADRLATYAQVKNTYLSTFQTLGSLGLMLGTIGLAVVLLRNLVERRAELALLAAIGIQHRFELLHPGLGHVANGRVIGKHLADHRLLTCSQSVRQCVLALQRGKLRDQGSAVLLEIDEPLPIAALGRVKHAPRGAGEPIIGIE
jgi:hypothetical protein